MLLNILKGQGIPCYVTGDESPIFGLGSFAGGDEVYPAVIMVPAPEAVRARRTCRKYAEISSSKPGSW